MLERVPAWSYARGGQAPHPLEEEMVLRRAVQRRARVAVHPVTKLAPRLLLLPADQHVNTRILQRVWC